MKRVSLWSMVVMMVAGVACAALAQTTALEKRVAGLERERMRAMVDVDIAMLETIMDSSMIYTHSTGLAQSRQQLLDALSSGEVDYVAFDTTEAVYRAYGNTVVVTGKQTIQLNVSGKALAASNRFTVVYVAADANGSTAQMVAYQSTALPKLKMEERQ